MVGEEKASFNRWIHAAAPGWVLLSPPTIFGRPPSRWFLCWVLFFLGMGPWLSSVAAVARMHLFLATDAFQVPSGVTEVAIAKYLFLRPFLASLLCLVQFFLLALLVWKGVRRRGLEVRFPQMVQWLGLACTPLFLKHMIAACYRLHASSVQSLAYWPTSLLGWMEAPRYTSYVRIILERADVMDVWSLCLLYGAILWLSGGRRSLASRTCLGVMIVVLAKDFILLTLYRILTSATVLEVIIQRFSSTIEYLYHI